MKTTIRKIGNSSGAILPAAVLKSLRIVEGDELEVSVSSDSIVLKPVVIKPEYKLEELISACVMSKVLPKELGEWVGFQGLGE